MPELPEVQATVDSVRPGLVGRRILAVRQPRTDIIRPRGFDLARHLLEDRVTDVARRAKRIVITLASGNRWYVHLGMTGRLVVAAPSSPLPRHSHLVLVLDDDNELRFVDPRRFGKIVWLGHHTDDEDLGPEPLTMRATELSAALARTRRAIKTALLDQHLIAGIGNIYADESLHAAGIHPKKPANRLTRDETQRLLRAIKTVLRRAIRSGGSTIRDYANGNNEPGSFQQQLAVYDREAEPCRRCRTPIVRIVLGGRGTHFCPKCQRAARTARSRDKT
jgi:formamidopyrimidine-DNA glycosylase